MVICGVKIMSVNINCLAFRVQDLVGAEARFLQYHTISVDQVKFAESDPNYWSTYMIGVNHPWLRLKSHTVMVLDFTRIKTLFHTPRIDKTNIHESYCRVNCYQLKRVEPGFILPVWPIWIVDCKCSLYVRVKLHANSICKLPVHLHSVGEFPKELSYNQRKPRWISACDLVKDSTKELHYGVKETLVDESWEESWLSD